MIAKGSSPESLVGRIKSAAAKNEFMEALCQENDVAARALEFTILTVRRTNEVIGAKWLEIDLDVAVWVVPARADESGPGAPGVVTRRHVIEA